MLGGRWIYDGTHDPVLVAQLAALIHGEAEPQAQSISNTPDPTVTVIPVVGGYLAAVGSEITGNGPSGTDLRVETADADGIRRGQLNIRLSRVLQPDGDAGGETGQPCLFATWRLPDGTRVRGTFATAQYAQSPAQ